MTRLERLEKQARDLAFDDAGARSRRQKPDVVDEIDMQHRVAMNDVEALRVWNVYVQRFAECEATYGQREVSQ